MPGEAITLERVHTEMRETHEEFKKYVDKGLEEARKSGEQSAETTTAIEKINVDLTELRKQHDELAAKAKRPGGVMLGGAEGRSEEEETEMEVRKSAFNKYLRHGSGETGRAVMDEAEQRALSSMTDADGGFLTPVDFESELITQAYDDAEIRPLVQVGTTSRDSVQLASISKPVVGWGTANVAVSPQDLAAGGERITIYDLRALTLIHNNTLDDAAADVWSELSDQFSMAVGEAEDLAFAVGAGNNSPQGVMANDAVLANFTKSGVAAAISDASNNGIDALIGVLYGLKKTYRRNATWAMNSLTEADVRKLKDTNGQYLWQPPVQAGAPATLLGRPTANPEGMPDVAANAFPIVCGDFRRGYKVRDRAGLTIQRLVEKYAEYDQTGFMIKKRTGGQVTLAEAFACMKIAA